MESQLEKINASLVVLDEYEKAMDAAHAALVRLADLPVTRLGYYSAGVCDHPYHIRVEQERATEPDRLQLDAGDLLVIVTGLDERIVKRIHIMDLLPAWLRKRGSDGLYGPGMTFKIDMEALPGMYLVAIVTDDRKEKGLLIKNQPRWSGGHTEEGMLRRARVPLADSEAVSVLRGFLSPTARRDTAPVKRAYEKFKEQMASYEAATEPAPKRPRLE